MSQTSERPARAPDPAGEFPRELTSYVFHLFAVVSRHREARLEEMLRPLGLNLSRHRALAVISGFEPCTMSELAEYTAVDRTTLTRTVDQLVDAGFVERATPREDRRQVVLTLTQAGGRACRQSLNAIFEFNRELLADLPEVDQRVAARVLESFLGRLVDDAGLLGRLTLRAAAED